MKGLKYVSWADTTGYAVAGKSYLRALLRAGVDLRWTPLLCPGERYREAPPDWQCAEPELAAVARRVFGYTVWELERLPAHWPAILNRLDGVLVPCRWNAEVFRRSGVNVPIHVVPHLPQFDAGPAPAGAREALLRRLGGPALDGRFVFYTIGFWTRRKAPDAVLEAYCRAFRRGDPVFLVIKTCAKDLTRWRRHWRTGFRLRHPPVEESAAALAARHPDAPPWCVVSDESLPETEMQALHDLGDAFVSLARAEGWGLGAFDAALRGKPVVMTGYGGQRDFLCADAAWLVDYDMVPVHEPVWSASYTPGDRWAEPAIDQAVAYMREIAARPEQARRRAVGLAAGLGERFSEEATVAALLGALRGDASEPRTT